MPVINSIAAMQDEMTAWRHDLHAHPELAYEEHRTSDFVAEKLASWGIEVTRGLGKTGLVGTLTGGKAGGGRSLALRADMDALPIEEANDLPYKSTNPGVMHACGHDGHTAILLGAAKYLAETRNFAGTVHFVFQPAEEGYAGAKKMIEDGLFTRFPTDEVYGLHNWPLLPEGVIGVRTGPIMAAADVFDIKVIGKGGHGAMPHQTLDPMPIAAQIVTALQTLVSRTADPLDAAVLSVTQFHAGTAHNVIADRVDMNGTVRTYKPETRAMMEEGIGRIARGIAETFGAQAEVVYRHGYPATVNHAREAGLIAEAAAEIVGAENVDRDVEPVMGAEDFSFMLEEKPGAFVFLGQRASEGDAMVHNPTYNFNDRVLPLGASLFATLVERRLAG